MKVVELFAGAGGMAVGLKKAGFETVFANDVDPNMCATFARNHPGAVVKCGNVAGIDSDEILGSTGAEIDLVAGGPPCQGFSTAGKKQEADPRNYLPLQFLRLVDELRPRAAFFENVSGFRRMYGGRVFDLVMSGFTDLGYRPHFALLNAVDYGAPQLRQRSVIVATRDGQPFEFPEPSHGPGDGLFADTTPHLTMEDALSDLPVIGPGESADAYVSGPRNAFQADRRRDSERPQYHAATNHGEHLRRVMSFVHEGGSIMDVPEDLRPRNYFANTYARLWWDRPSTTVTRNFGTPSSARCIHPLVDRGLTIAEGARLQTFDDTYRFEGPDTSIRLQIGNAVPPVLAEVVGNAIYKSLT